MSDDFLEKLSRCDSKEEKIICLHVAGKTNYQIRQITGCRFQKIKDVIKKFHEYDQIPSSPERGKPKKLSNHVLTSILTLTTINRLFTSI